MRFLHTLDLVTKRTWPHIRTHKKRHPQNRKNQIFEEKIVKYWYTSRERIVFSGKSFFDEPRRERRFFLFFVEFVQAGIRVH